MKDTFKVKYGKETFVVSFSVIDDFSWEFPGDRVADKATECTIERDDVGYPVIGFFSLIAHAYCSKHDVYDKVTGYKLALARALSQVPLTREFRTAVWREFWEWVYERDNKFYKIGKAIAEVCVRMSEILEPVGKSVQELCDRRVETGECMTCTCNRDERNSVTFSQLKDGDFFLIKGDGPLFRKEGVGMAALVGHNKRTFIFPDQVVVVQ